MRHERVYCALIVMAAGISLCIVGLSLGKWLTITVFVSAFGGAFGVLGMGIIIGGVLERSHRARSCDMSKIKQIPEFPHPLVDFGVGLPAKDRRRNDVVYGTETTPAPIYHKPCKQVVQIRRY